MGTLTAEETKKAAKTFMLAAMAHQRASVYCMDKPDAKPPNIDFLLFPAVSFELILLSAEQSLRLLLLLHYSVIRSDTNHNPHALYKTLTKRSGGKEGIRQDIVREMNMLGQTKNIDPISENELRSCLKKHDSSYTSTRYFQLNRDARSTSDWELLPREVQIFHCFALALLSLNKKEMEGRGIGVPMSLRLLPDSEMTEEERAIKERLTS